MSRDPGSHRPEGTASVMAHAIPVRYAIGNEEDQNMSDGRTDDTSDDMPEWDTIQKMIDGIVERAAENDWNWMRLLGPGVDSGWLNVGDNPHESGKYQARRNYGSGEGFYFIAKRDRANAELRTPETIRPFQVDRIPQPVWHRQKPWSNDFPLPADLWSGPPADGRPTKTSEDIRRGMAEQIAKLSKGPALSFEERLVMEALKRPSERDR